MLLPICWPLVEPALRGGWRQRREQRAAADVHVRPPPRMALNHLRDWGEGLISARKLVCNMDDAVQDGEVTHPMIHRLAAAATRQGV